MGLFTALASALRAAEWWLRVVYPAKERRRITREIEQYEDEIFLLADSGHADDKLQIERLAERKRRAIEHLGALRSPDDHAD